MKKLLFISLLTITALAQLGDTIKVTPLADEDRRKKISQTILDNQISENYEDVRKDFAEGLKQNLPVEKLAEGWRQIINVYGSFKKVLSVTAAADKGYNQIRMRVQFEKGNLTQETTFTEDDQVIGLFMKP
jgi:Protein of unknown function (DUF3887)